MKREQIEQIALLCIGCIVIIYVCFTFLLKPKWKKLEETSKQYTQLMSDLNIANRKIKRLPVTRINVNKMQAYVDEQERDLFINDFGDFVKIIRNATEKPGLKLNKISPNNNLKIRRSDYYTEHWVTLDTKASYHVIGTCIDELENLSPFVRIVSISTKATPGAYGMHDASVTVGFLVKSKNGKQ